MSDETDIDLDDLSRRMEGALSALRSEFGTLERGAPRRTGEGRREIR